MAIDLPPQNIQYEQKESGIFVPKSPYVIRGYEEAILPGILPGAGLVGGAKPLEVEFLYSNNIVSTASSVHTFPNVPLGDEDSTRRIVVLSMIAGVDNPTTWSSIQIAGNAMTSIFTNSHAGYTNTARHLAYPTGTSATIAVYSSTGTISVVLAVYAVYNGASSASYSNGEDYNIYGSTNSITASCDAGQIGMAVAWFIDSRTLSGYTGLLAQDFNTSNTSSRWAGGRFTTSGTKTATLSSGSALNMGVYVTWGSG